MTKKKFMLVGSGGRESAFAQRLMDETILYAVIGHKNPTIVDCVITSGGDYLIGDAGDPQTVLNYAKLQNIDYVFVSADQPLANGVVDILLQNNIKAVGGSKAATRIEWDKVYSINLMRETCPEFTPFYLVINKPYAVSAAIEEFKQKNLAVVVKPQGLTGGKGVKVMPEHLPDYDAAADYACSLLQNNPNEKVLLVEKLHGIEFTIMGITDGKNLSLAPASYDYPFRLENDLGAGTGGMGCFTDTDGKLPFINDKDLADCKYIMQRIIDKMRMQNILFNGVLNAGFFISKHGIKFMEFNARFGDPEGLNILTVLKGSFAKMIEDIYHQRLDSGAVEFSRQASVVKYLVAKEYPNPSPNAIDFTVDEAAIADMGLGLFFASCTKTASGYQTLKTSRILALVAKAASIPEAADLINTAIAQHIGGDLHARHDIGTAQNLHKLAVICGNMSK